MFIIGLYIDELDSLVGIGTYNIRKIPIYIYIYIQNFL